MTAPHDGIDRAPTWRRVFRSGVLFSILGLFQLSAYSPVVARQALINGTLDTYEGYLALGVDHADAIVSDETFEDLEALTNLAVLKLSGIDVTVVTGGRGRSSDAAPVRRAITFSSSVSAWAPGGGDGASEVLIVDSGLVEPAVPLNLSLKVRVFAMKRLIEITVTVAKRSGYPTDRFFDRNVTAQISLLPGLQLEDGRLSWSGDLKGDQVAEFVAKVRAVHDTVGVIEATAIGHALGGRIDADKERFHIIVSGEQIRVTRLP